MRRWLLPDDSTGQGPCTLARNLSRCRFLIAGRCPACPDRAFSERRDVRVQEPLQICLECRSKSKKCDKQLTHIVRVMVRYVICQVNNNTISIKVLISNLALS